MATQQLSVELPSGTLYVSGTVNGVSVTWTNTEGTTWQTVVERASDDIYVLDMTLINSTGTTNRQQLRLYYGLHLITDRTQADVDRAIYLNSLFVYDVDTGTLVWTGTDEELAEFNSATLKGAYNYTDLNRVGAAMNYVASKLTGAGYSVEISPKTNWVETEWMTYSSAAHYLADLEELRTKFSLYETTPDPPADMEFLTYTEANNIEKILEDIDALLTNIMAAWFYSGDLYSGEV